MRPSKPVRDLKSEECSTRPDARDREPDRDLDNEDFSAKPDPRVNPPLRDLKIDVFSTKLEAIASVPLKLLVRPLTWEAVRDSEPVKDLEREDFSVAAEANPNEPVCDLYSEVCSARLERVLIAAVKLLARPLVWDTARPSELLKDLNNEDFSAKPETEPKEPV